MVRTDYHQRQGGDLLTLIHILINLSQSSESPGTLVDPHMEELTITAKLGNTDLIITNICIPPQNSCTGGYNPLLDHLMMTTDTILVEDFNAHHSLWYSSSTDSRGTMLKAWCLVLTSVFLTGMHQIDCRATPTQLPMMSH